MRHQTGVNFMRQRRRAMIGTLKRAWIPLLILVVVAIAGFTVQRIRTFFGSEGILVTPKVFADDPEPFDPKVVEYEVSGSGSYVNINYLDLDAKPQRIDGAALPWSLTLKTTAPSAAPQHPRARRRHFHHLPNHRRWRSEGRADRNRRGCPDLLLCEIRMIVQRTAAPTGSVPPDRHAARPFIPRMIRTFAVPIILGWLVTIAVLNVTVPQLETVGQIQAVSMSPDAAPSMISMKHIGKVFEEGDSDSAAMIVLEGQRPLGDAAHAFYDQMIGRLQADTTHVQSLQDFWGGSTDRHRRPEQRRQGAYVQVKLAGNQGESLANESVEAVKTIVERLAPPPGVKVYVTGSAALVADQQQAGDRSLQVIEAVTFTVIIVMLLLVYRSIITSAIMLTMVVLGLLATRGGRGFPRFPPDHWALDLRDQPARGAGDRGRHRLRHLPDRPLPGSTRARPGPGVGVLHHVRRHRPCRAGLGSDHRGCHVLSELHPTAVLSDPRCAVGDRDGHRRRRRTHPGPGDNRRDEPVRQAARAQADGAGAGLAQGRGRHRPLARPHPGRCGGPGARRSADPAGLPDQLQRPQLPARRPTGQRRLCGRGAPFLPGPDEPRGADGRKRPRHA